MGLSRAEREACAPSAVDGQCLQDTRIDRPLVQPPLGVPLAIAAHRLLGVPAPVQELPEPFADRRPDRPSEVLGIGRNDTERRQGVSIAAEDSGGRIHKSAIEIEEERAARSNWHVPTLAGRHPSVSNGACVTNAPSEYDGAELYE